MKALLEVLAEGEEEIISVISPLLLLISVNQARGEAFI